MVYALSVLVLRGRFARHLDKGSITMLPREPRQPVSRREAGSQPSRSPRKIYLDHHELERASDKQTFETKRVPRCINVNL